MFCFFWKMPAHCINRDPIKWFTSISCAPPAWIHNCSSKSSAAGIFRRSLLHAEHMLVPSETDPHRADHVVLTEHHAL
jgi:hypothetical protein